MALIKCYECCREVSSLAPACPHCGAPAKNISRPEVAAPPPAESASQPKTGDFAATALAWLSIPVLVLVGFIIKFAMDRPNESPVASDVPAAAEIAEKATVEPAIETTRSSEPELLGNTAFGSFAAETRRLEDEIGCLSPNITDANNPPALWGCIGGFAETVKLFVNETDGGGGVRNVKFMWNDWTIDGGYGLHADRDIAEAWLTAIATVYAPEQVADVLQIFRGKRNEVLTSDRFRLTYSYDQGPGIGERLLLIESL